MSDDCYAYAEFELECPEKRKLAIGRSSVRSKDVFAGGHAWKVDFYPRGSDEKDNGEHVSVFLKLMSNSNNVSASFEAVAMNSDGMLSPSSHAKKTSQNFPPVGCLSKDWGWPQFAKRSDLESHARNGLVTIVCRVNVEAGSLVIVDPIVDPLSAPPSDIASHFGKLLDSTEGSDVTFLVGSEMFPAHRAVLAARSPVFKAQLLGSMADAKMSSITLHDIAAATFKIMLQFMYTDALPEDLGDSTMEVFPDLLAVADRYALDRLKLICASKLWENVSVETFAATLTCAETYSCPELKKKCIGFFAEEKNFKKIVVTDGYVQLMQKFPSILAELREKIGA